MEREARGVDVTEDHLLALAEHALDADDLPAAARWMDELHHYQHTHPLPPLPRNGGRTPPQVVDTVANAVERELARAQNRRLSPPEAVRATLARLREQEQGERRYGRAGHALRTAEVVAALEVELARVTAPTPKLEVPAGEQLPYGWMATARATPWPDVATALGWDRKGGRYTPCPACGRQSESRGSVLTRPGQWHCVACEEGGSAIDAVGWRVLGRRPEGREDLDAVGRFMAGM